VDENYIRPETFWPGLFAFEILCHLGAELPAAWAPELLAWSILLCFRSKLLFLFFLLIGIL
jgi:hypothetical protein